MKLVHVIPISKSLRKESLSYFSNKDIKSGSVVFVPIRNKIVPSIAIRTEDVSKIKSRIKSSQYSIKKIEKETTNKLFIPEFMEAVSETAKYFASQISAVLNQVIPKVIIENLEKIPQHKNLDSVNKGIIPEKLILQADEDTRAIQYKNLVRESFAKNSSVYICVPTIKDAERIESRVNKGIEKYVSILHSEIPKKKLFESIKKNIEEEHPVLIIGTGTFLSIPRNDIKTIIIEKEASRIYKTQSIPFIDFRVLATFYAERLKARLIFADMPIRVETEYNYRKGKYDELMTKKSLATINTKQIIVDMKKEDKDKKFKILSNELIKILNKSEKTGENVFLLNARRGISSTTVCQDCGTVVKCKNCNSPAVLHKGTKENLFVCHKCGDSRSAKEKCLNCDSWNLKALGVGVERTHDEIKKIFPDRKIFIVDRDTTKTYKQIQNVIRKFYESKSAILIGTEMAIQYLDDVDYSAVVSIDSLLALPDIYAYERSFSILLSMRKKAKNVFVLQTRQVDLPIINYARDGNIQNFLSEEISMRNSFKYPPFYTLIKITTVGTKAKTYKEMRGLEKYFDDYDFKIYPIFDMLGAKKFALSGFIKIQSTDWVNEKLLSKLNKLPPNFSINVNP